MFDNIKVGDVVLLTVSYGWNNFFRLQHKVTKTTATRFKVGREVFLKKNGRLYGDSYSIRQAYVYSKEMDDTENYNRHRTIEKAKDIISGFKFKNNDFELAEKIIELLGKDK